ncbi:MAG: DUF711 family protein [Candidatus Lokiarchaeota archaeon]|nr:DUF711 family protein [Candidatus Lokiarchaeota archaeon]
MLPFHAPFAIVSTSTSCTTLCIIHGTAKSAMNLMRKESQNIILRVRSFFLVLRLPQLSQKKFDLDTLLLYSCLCGTGLNCIPLPGDIIKYFILRNKSISARIYKFSARYSTRFKYGEDILSS